MQDFRKLLVWQKSHHLALEIHRLTESWSRRENAGLIGQLRRAALSIPSNIAEGAGRKGDKEFSKFLQIAIGSSTEVEYQLIFAAETGLVQAAVGSAITDRVIEVRRMLIGLQRKLRGDRS